MMAPFRQAQEGVASRPSCSRTMAAAPPPSAPKPHHSASCGNPTRPCPKGQVVGHQPPWYAATQDVQYAVHHLSQINSAGTPLGRIREQQGFQQAPLQVCQIRGICFSMHIPKVATSIPTRQTISLQVWTIVTHPLRNCPYRGGRSIPPELASRAIRVDQAPPRPGGTGPNGRFGKRKSYPSHEGDSFRMPNTAA